MKLDKLQRHTVYIIMLSEAENDMIYVNGERVWLSNGWGMCHILYYTLGIADTDNSCYFGKVINIYLPELAAKENGGWPRKDEEGWKKRIEFLKECIEETY